MCTQKLLLKELTSTSKYLIRLLLQKNDEEEENEEIEEIVEVGAI